MRHEFIGPRLSLRDNVLNATGRELVRVMYALPGRDRLRRVPAQLANRRPSKRNSFERRDGWISAGNARNETAFDLDGLIDSPAGRCRHENNDPIELAHGSPLRLDRRSLEQSYLKRVLGGIASEAFFLFSSG